jgi:hypothetical protein
MSESLSIWSRSRGLEKDRRLKMQELMAEYDRDVYFPARKELINECGLVGHSSAGFESNGFGWSWSRCRSCGARTNLVGPEGAEPDSL